MKIKKLHIKNFKSIADLEIIEPNPFTVFVGPNGSGKSNIFEALEFTTSLWKFNYNFQFIQSIFGDTQSLLNHSEKNILLNSTSIEFNNFSIEPGIIYGKPKYGRISDDKPDSNLPFDNSDYKQFVRNISVIFPNNVIRERFKMIDDRFLSLSCSNLENVLKRVLQDDLKKEEMLEWLTLFVPELEDINVYSDTISGKDTLLIKEKYIEKPFNKSLISDGTYNILALLTAVFQSDEPQFLCIEEPENGLNPKVVRELVGFFRYACKEKGHYIWLNSHSQTLLAELKEEELIIVDKKLGKTQIKQFKKGDFYGLRADEALLTNVLGGGIPW